MRIGSVLVKGSGRPTGTFTERDLLTRILARGVSMDVAVGDLASTPLIMIASGSSIRETALTMASRHISRLPVTEGDEIVGIVTARDLVEAYSE